MSNGHGVLRKLEVWLRDGPLQCHWVLVVVACTRTGESSFEVWGSLATLARSLDPALGNRTSDAAGKKTRMFLLNELVMY